MPGLPYRIVTHRMTEWSFGWLMEPQHPYAAWFHAAYDPLGNVKTIPCTMHEQCFHCQEMVSTRRLRGFIPLVSRDKSSVVILDLTEFALQCWIQQRMIGHHDPGHQIRFRRETKMPRSRLIVEPGEPSNKIQVYKRPWVQSTLNNTFPGAQWVPLEELAAGLVLPGNLDLLRATGEKGATL